MSMTSMGFSPIPLSQRIPRRPRHQFLVKHRPWQIQPIMIAPVLAGETMQNLLLQSRAVTSPIKNALIGWWIEYFFFYVKLRDIQFMNNANTHPWIEAMLLDPNWDHSTSIAYETAARVETFKAANSIDWVNLCLNRVVECYFRLDGETVASGMLGNLPTVSIYEDENQGEGANWFQSLTDVDSITWDTGINVDLNADSVITTTEIDQAMRKWQYLVQTQQTTMSYQEYLKQFGISVPVDDLHRPELLRFSRNWQYPSNTISATDGSASSAVSWSVAERADKDRFFGEPGFIFGVSVLRPKVQANSQTDAAVMMLRNAFGWLPQLMADAPETSMQLFAGGAAPVAAKRGPLGNKMARDHYIDVRDLYLYGDQFWNYTVGGESNAVGLPGTGFNKRFATGGDADGLFKSATANTVAQDGIVSLNILGTQADTSPLDQRYS